MNAYDPKSVENAGRFQFVPLITSLRSTSMVFPSMILLMLNYLFYFLGAIIKCHRSIPGPKCWAK